MKMVPRFFAIAALIGGVAFGLLISGFNPFATGLLPPCPTEDSPACYWDGSENGNGVGNDLVNP